MGGRGSGDGLGVSFTVHDEVPQQDARLLDEGLEAANRTAAPLHDVRPLACFARLPTGEVVGGALARTWGHACELQQLWVAVAYRRQGIGRRLVRDVERVAMARGCTLVYLETFSFQAPGLYRSLGYEVRCELRGFPPGVVRFTMARDLDAGAPAS